jgi:hypothetical protein
MIPGYFGTLLTIKTLKAGAKYMSHTAAHYAILWTVLIITGAGSLFLMKYSPLRYGIMFILSSITAILLCLLFYRMGFYRYALPMREVLPAAALSFSFFALLLIRYRPEKNTFPFFFISITAVFSIEVLLKDAAGFIRFRNGWDYWDSYSLYWLYLRLMGFAGEFFIPEAYRAPVRSDTKGYWILFIFMLIYAGFGIYILNKRLEALIIVK